MARVLRSPYLAAAAILLAEGGVDVEVAEINPEVSALGSGITLQGNALRILDKLGVSDPVFDVARELEHIALNDPYFIEKKLYPNIDFYSGITLKALGFPTTMFTVLFALARTVGWIAQWKEMVEDPSQKIGRPRQLYTGSAPREVKPLAQR